jgi:uncharacterized zinc-type alcohol dehydrogenase-like protein
MFKAHGYAAHDQHSHLVPFSFERRAPGVNDVVIEILYSGVCHSDLHQARDDWGGSIYPMVPGHEIIGRVTQVGSGVHKFKVGDLAGVGCMVDSCRHCSACRRPGAVLRRTTVTYNGRERDSGAPTYGGYSDIIVVDEHFVVKVSDKLDLKAARRCCAPASPPTRRCATGRSARARRSA